MESGNEKSYIYPMETEEAKGSKLWDVLDFVFSCQDASGNNRTSASLRTNLLDTFTSHVQLQVAEVEKCYWQDKIANLRGCSGNGITVGRIGPSKVTFRDNFASKFTSFDAPLGLICKESFASRLAKTGIYQGKWQYEVIIGSCGVMQVGWATVDSPFTSQEGVGDTPQSYSYDGNRQRAWNVTSTNYGDIWQTGDVITCSIDLDSQTIAYQRNGKNMGVAFSEIPVGEGYAYFPAMSLSKGEYLRVNFGETPLLYPQPRYKPLQDPPSLQRTIAKACLQWLDRLFDFSLQQSQQKTSTHSMQSNTGLDRSHSSTCLLVAQQLLQVLTPLLTGPDTAGYIVQAELIPYMERLLPEQYMKNSTGNSSASFPPLDSCHNLQKLSLLLDHMLAFMKYTHVLGIFGHLLNHLYTLSTQPDTSTYFYQHRAALRLLGAVLSHGSARRMALQHLLFTGLQSSKLQYLFSMTMDDTVLKKELSGGGLEPWGATSAEISTQKELHQSQLKKLEQTLHEVEVLHCAVVRLLLTVEHDMPYPHTSRAIFLNKIRNVTIKSSLNMNKASSSIVGSLFRAILKVFFELWVDLPCSERQCLPLRLYCGDGPPAALDCLEVNRLGGLYSHLAKNLKAERLKLLLKDGGKIMSSCDGCAGSIFGCAATDVSSGCSMEVDPYVGAAPEEQMSGSCSDSTGTHTHLAKRLPSSAIIRSVHELGDSVLMLYHYCAHRGLVRVGAVVATLEKLGDRAASVVENLVSLQAVPESKRNATVYSQLVSTYSELQKNSDIVGANLTWQRSLHFTSITLRCYHALVQLALNTLTAASATGELFAFLPDFFVDVLSELSLVLAGNESIANFKVADTPVYRGVTSFLCRHFLDSRVRYTDARDALMQAVAAYVTCSATLGVMEGTSTDCRRALVRSLLQPYENRSWAQNNWILVRFWKGSGFAFRYYHSPHIEEKITPKPTYADASSQIIKPTPSQILQHDVAVVLREDPASSLRFISSLLTQLNWAFSEFIGMMQEIQNFSYRSERVFVDSRQLRVCCTCFELTVSLLRVLEFVLAKAAHLLVGEQGGAEAEVLLAMLCKLLSQVLSRVSPWSSRCCFGHVVSLEIPGLDHVHHFPLLTATAGVLLYLLREDVLARDNPHHDPVATRALVTDPNFQMSCFEALLGENPARSTASNASVTSTAAPETPSASLSEEPGRAQAMEKNISNTTGGVVNMSSLYQYPSEVSTDEIHQLELCLTVMRLMQDRLPSSPVTTSRPGDPVVQECVICYARPAAATFNPCGHTSCRACITQHLMSHKDCFFCMTSITSVRDQTRGDVVYDSNQTRVFNVVSQANENVATADEENEERRSVVLDPIPPLREDNWVPSINRRDEERGGIVAVASTRWGGISSSGGVDRASDAHVNSFYGRSDGDSPMREAIPTSGAWSEPSVINMDRTSVAVGVGTSDEASSENSIELLIPSNSDQSNAVIILSNSDQADIVIGTNGVASGQIVNDEFPEGRGILSHENSPNTER